VKELSPHYPKARRHLARRDPVLKKLIASIGPCTLQLNQDYFTSLVRSIVAQQISTKAARSIFNRLRDTVRELKPAAILQASDEALRLAGLSESKRRSLRDLAEKVHSGAVPLTELHTMEDEDVIEKLVPVRGIGRWTAQMFLIFSLGRLDVLAVDDLGLRVGVQRHYGLAERPGKKQLEAVGEPWRPYRSIATWYFWRSFGAVPQSGAESPPAKAKRP
jgi:DNA-3-methyladenine glycosylase II